MLFVTRKSRRLYYDVIEQTAPWCESQPPILFHHGVGAASGIWTDWIAQLGADYRLITFDMCGFGRSDVPDAGSPWTMESLAQDVLAIADAAGATNFHFVGESMGGTIGLYCAIRHPGRFKSLTISNGSHVGGSIEKVEMWSAQIRGLGMSGWSDQFMKDRFFPDALSAERWDWFSRQQSASNGSAVLGALTALVGTDLRAELANVQQPVLLLHGDSSPFIPVTIMADLHAALPNSEMQVFAHAKHGLPFSHGKECAVVVRDFLARLNQTNNVKPAHRVHTA